MLIVKIRRRFVYIGILLIFFISALNPPNSFVAASESTTFQVFDSFTFKMTNFDLRVTLNGTDKINTNNLNFVSIGEPMDVTVTKIDILDPVTSESNVSAVIDFKNSTIVDPSQQFYANTLLWDDHVQLGGLLSILLVGNFDPYDTDFNETVLTEDLFYADPTTQPENGSLLFPVGGGQMMPFLVDISEAYVNELLDSYLSFWTEEDAIGTPQDGYHNRTTVEDIAGSDFINVTQWLNEYVNWDNETKIFDISYGIELLHFGTFNNGVDYYSHSNYSVEVKIDYKKGIVLFYDQELMIEYSIPDASYYLLYNFGFTEDSSNPEMPDPKNSRSLVISTPSNVISKSDPINSTTSLDGTATDPTINFSTPGTILSAIIILQIYIMKKKKAE